MPNISESDLVAELAKIGARGPELQDQDVREAIRLARAVFRSACRRREHDKGAITAILTKFTDAGRRSAPWKPTSSKVPGRPQDGADGNRIRRWLLDKNHKFYASEVDATLVEIKYILQALSMTGAPAVENGLSLMSWSWLCPLPAQPGTFRDPIRLTAVRFEDFLNDRRFVTSGHIDPLDLTGRHVHSNTSLMLKTSNDLQGNLQVTELLNEMWYILCEQEKQGLWTRPETPS